MGTNTPHTCIPGLVWQKQAGRCSQFELKVGELGFPIHFVCIFVLRKKGSKTKERMKEEEIEKGDCGPPTRKVYFFGFVGLELGGWSGGVSG